MAKTILEKILTYPGVADGEDFVETVLEDRSLDGAVSYTVDQKQSVQLAVADVYAFLGGLADFTENKLSMTYPRSWYTQKAKELYLANGEPEKANSLGKSIKVPRGKAPKSW